MQSQEAILKPNFHQIVTVSFYKYTGLQKLWALKEMQTAKGLLSEIPGLHFFRLSVCSGDSAFKLAPDLSVYVLIGVWKNRNYASNFYKYSRFIKSLKKHSSEWWTIYMQTLKSTGAWDGKNPFLPAHPDSDYSGPIAVINRTAASPLRLFSFSNSDHEGGELHKGQNGLIFSKSISEFFQQTTFSIWNTKEDATQYAYQNRQAEKEAPQTKLSAWLNKDSYSEFKILSSEGKWKGVQLNLVTREERVTDSLQKVLNDSH